MKVKIKKLHPNAVIPTYATSGSACFDLTCVEIEKVSDNRFKVKFGIACEIEDGYKICIVPRSSFTFKSFIMANSPGQIDSDYRGEIMMFVEAFPNWFNGEYFQYMDLPFKVGERCAQAFIEKVIQTEFEEVNELSETIRGTGGLRSGQ